MKMPWSSLEGPAKVLAICGVVLLVSSGLCGLQSVIAFNGNGGSLDAIFIPLGIFELVAMAGSVLVGLLTLMVWGINAAVNRSQPDGDAPNLGRDNDPHTLFPRENPPSHDEKK
ncbi:MAG: hypothetical protein ABR928_04860 [Terracidiphilus sp.]|jgi:hypothetical protein